MLNYLVELGRNKVKLLSKRLVKVRVENLGIDMIVD